MAHWTLSTAHTLSGHVSNCLLPPDCVLKVPGCRKSLELRTALHLSLPKLVAFDTLTIKDLLPGACLHLDPYWQHPSRDADCFDKGLWQPSAISEIGIHVPHSGHANQDSNAVARDQVYIIRNTTACSNKLSSTAMAPVTSASILGQLVTSASSGG